MKKVIAFLGSPRKKGNTSDVVHEVLRGASDAGAQTKIYHLNDMNIKGCQGCLYCRENDSCIIKDDMHKIYEDIKDADAVVIGSPVYICQLSAQTKLLLDRFYALTDAHHKPRFGEKKTLMVYTQAAPFEIFFKKYYKYTEKHLKPMGLNIVGRIVGTKSTTMGAVAKNARLMQKAYNAGKSLISNSSSPFKRLLQNFQGA